MNKVTPTIAILGAGNMGSSLLGGLINKGYATKQLWAADPSTEKLHSLKQQFNIPITTDNREAVKTAETVPEESKSNMLLWVLIIVAIVVIVVAIVLKKKSGKFTAWHK